MILLIHYNNRIMDYVDFCQAFNFSELAPNLDIQYLVKNVPNLLGPDTFLILACFHFSQLERDKGQQREGPEFLRVKERLRRTAVMDAGEKQE